MARRPWTFEYRTWTPEFSKKTLSAVLAELERCKWTGHLTKPIPPSQPWLLNRVQRCPSIPFVSQGQPLQHQLTEGPDELHGVASRRATTGTRMQAFSNSCVRLLSGTTSRRDNPSRLWQNVEQRATRSLKSSGCDADGHPGELPEPSGDVWEDRLPASPWSLYSSKRKEFHPR